MQKSNLAPTALSEQDTRQHVSSATNVKTKRSKTINGKTNPIGTATDSIAQNDQVVLKKSKGRQYGGAAMEYILVTTFATVVGIAALGFVGKVIKEKLSVMGDKLGVTGSAEIDTDLFGSPKK